MITCLCVLKKNVTDSINNEAIINKNEKLVERNFKTLCIWDFFFLMLIYSSFIFIKFCLI